MDGVLYVQSVISNVLIKNLKLSGDFDETYPLCV